jgi:sec-independent protein translocase protein TatA
MIGALQPMHLIVVLAIVLVIFGPGKLPQLGKAIGDGMRELKQATNGETPVSSAPVAALPIASCASCNMSLTSDSRFCGGCGANVAKAPVVA